MRPAILDTSVYVGYLERGLYEFAMAAIERSFRVRQSAVVLSELRRGASRGDGRRIVERLWRRATEVWEPTAADWWDAGRLIQEFGDARHWNTAKRRDFQNDALIALTARRHGATIVTADRADFELLEGPLRLSVRFI
jgi:predicted nucleic acid-binding protein